MQLKIKPLKKYLKQKAYQTSLLAALLLFCIAGWQYHSFTSTFDAVYQPILKEHTHQQSMIDKNILQKYDQIYVLAHQISKDLNKGTLTPSNAKSYLQQAQSHNPSIESLHINFDIPAKPGKGQWHSQFDPRSQTLSTHYLLPSQYTQDGNTHHAMVSITMARHNVQDVSYAFSKNHEGFALLATRNGLMIALPDPKITDPKQRKHNAKALIKRSPSHQLTHLLQHKKHLFNFRHTYNNRSYHIQSYHVANAKLWIGYKINRQAINHLMSISKKPLLWFLFWASFGVAMLVTALIYYLPNITKPKPWIKLIYALYFAMAATFVLYAHDESDLPYLTQTHRIDDAGMLQQFADKHLPNITHIPTGIEILHISNTGNQHSYRITALVWQTLPPNSHIGCGPNITFLNSIKFTKSKKIYEHITKQYHQAMWEIFLTVEHHDDMTRYPFDETLLNLSMLPKNFGPDVQLTPDFSSYHDSHHLRKQGILQHTSMTDQSIQSSFFNFAKNPLAQELRTFSATTSTPYALNFSIELSRDSTQTFFTYFIPLIVILLLTYASLLVMEQRIYSTIDTKLTFTSGMIVVLTFIHIRYHDQYDSNLFTYMDALLTYLYFLALMVVACIVLYRKNTGEPTWAKSMARWFRSMFWPLSSAVFLAITLFFYL